MSRAALLALLAVALGVAACGSANTAQTISTDAGTLTLATGPTTTRPQPLPVTTTTAATAPTVSTVGSVSSTPPPATVTTETITAPDSGGAGLPVTSASSECVAADLSLAAVAPNSAPGMTVLGLTLTNTSQQACESGAYPGVGLITGSGQVVDVATVRTTSDDLGATPVTKIDLGPGQEMSFRITLHDAGGGSGAGCAEYSGVQIIAPNDTATLKVSIPDGPVQSCGSVGVSPVEPGANGTGQ